MLMNKNSNYKASFIYTYQHEHVSEMYMKIFTWIIRTYTHTRERGWGGRENSNSETLFYKDCSLGSVKNLSINRPL